jgi:hypothetical protein
MTVSRDDLRELLDSSEEQPLLVLCAGRVSVIAASAIGSSDFAGAVELATREEILSRAGTAIDDDELGRLAAQLDIEVGQRGA